MTHNEKPPMLESEAFFDWKVQMYLYLITIDDEMVTILNEGPIKIEKEKGEWTAEDMRRNNIDNHCRRHIFKSLDRNTFGKVRDCTTTKEAWEMKFENIKMKPGETMNEFSDRFTNVVNELSTLEKKYNNKEIIVKALRSLPSTWDIKTMVMRESNSLGQMKLHDVFEDLNAYEFEIRSRIEDESSTSNATIDLVTFVEPTVPAPIKIAKQFTEDAMTMLARKFERFIKKSQPSNNNNYNYNYGHYRSECRRPRRDDRRPDDRRPDDNNQIGEYQQSGEDKEIQKALLADDGGSYWAYSDTENNDNKFPYLMAKEEEVFDFSFEEFIKEDLVTTLNDMVIEFKNLSALVPTRLNVHTDQPSNFQTGESIGTKTDEPVELSYENEKLKETVQSLTEEN
ncbi:uncharacterized protein LOC124918450 [Impatiens glandulifera]|uniref:uncharacterized protein LOC124918450 n=1 Tax=Impatiens glandulifera TaxID=253017 RepID=UPI001FB078CB|nr:uncharacterized protein LOC124918450 [Impatiens glandulifera]